MKKYKNIIFQIEGHLGLLTIDRPKENNVLDIETSKEIYEGLKELEQNSSIRAVLILGNKKFFSPGADIKELSNLDSRSAKLKGLFNFFDNIKEIEIPILAAVEGYALGGGMELALLCDIIIASTESKFAQPEINKLISHNQALEQGLEKERKSFYSLLDSENAKRGISAFLGKTKTEWQD